LKRFGKVYFETYALVYNITWIFLSMRHYATSQKAEGSIPGKVMALRFTQPLTEMSARESFRG
jgi:hypothetical protein